MVTNAEIYRRVNRPKADVIAGYAELSVADVHEVMTRDTLLESGLCSLTAGSHIAGPVVTALNCPDDSLSTHVALDLCRPGDVLVIGSVAGTAAMWGGLASQYAVAIQLAGVVIDGSTRDAAAIRELGLPVWTRQVSARRPTKSCIGGVNVPVVCGGTIVRPGDIVVADDDGVVVVPQEAATSVLADAEARAARERALLPELAAGRSPFTLQGMAELVERSGARIKDAAFPSNS